MIRFLNSVAILSLTLLVGCDQASLMKRITPSGGEAAARNYVDLLRQQKFDQIERNMDPGVNEPDIRNTLATMAATFPAQEPTSVKVVGAHVMKRGESSVADITLEYGFSDGEWLLARRAAELRR